LSGEENGEIMRRLTGRPTALSEKRAVAIACLFSLALSGKIFVLWKIGNLESGILQMGNILKIKILHFYIKIKVIFLLVIWYNPHTRLES
jgi:hypothetical protein